MSRDADAPSADPDPTGGDPPRGDPGASGSTRPRRAAADSDTTLGGYLKEHRRPPAFEGLDGEPYTVALEVENSPSLGAPWEGYLVFPRWASTGLGVIGHVETQILVRERTRERAAEALRSLSLGRVKELLDQAILGRRGGGADRAGPEGE
jgi:hypothetical protein